jgi:hypothetical protein
VVIQSSLRVVQELIDVGMAKPGWGRMRKVEAKVAAQVLLILISGVITTLQLRRMPCAAMPTNLGS